MNHVPITAMVPSGSGWAKGEHYVWAERSTYAPRQWVYWHTMAKDDMGRAGWCSDTGCSPARFRTKADALRAGVRYIKVTYHAELFS